MISLFAPSSTSQIHWNWVTLTGPDAKDFLHRLTTVHVKGLKMGDGAPGCFLTAQGKMRSYFTLWCFGPQDYAFEFDSGSSEKGKAELLNIIDQYTFGEKISVLDATPELECRWIFPGEKPLSETPIGSLEPGHTLAIEEEIRVAHHGSTPFGQPWITVWGKPARLSQWIERAFPNAPSLNFSEIEAWRIQTLQPRVDFEITETALPLEIALDQSIAQNKGCYPGQEVIEKIIARGAPPRRLVRIEGEGNPPQQGEMILNLADPPIDLGVITSISVKEDSNPPRFSALGLLRKIHAKEGLQVKFQTTKNTVGVISKVAHSS